MIFQMMVAVFTAALISGAIAERMKFSSYLVFALAVDDPRLRPGGALGLGARTAGSSRLGALDFAGGLVVHLTSGLAALCCVRVLGKRKGLDHEDLHPHNLTLTALGTGLLWFGWLGLNVGQARGANAAAVAAFVCDEPGGCRRDRELEHPRVFPETEGDHARCVHRRDRRPGRGDARGRLCHARGCDLLGVLVGPFCLRSDPDQGEARLRRLARRLRRPRRRRPRSASSGVGVRGDAEPDRAGPAACSTATPTCCSPRRSRWPRSRIYTVVVTLVILVVDRPVRRPARDSRRRRPRPRPHPARPARLHDGRGRADRRRRVSLGDEVVPSGAHPSHGLGRRARQRGNESRTTSDIASSARAADGGFAGGLAAVGEVDRDDREDLELGLRVLARLLVDLFAHAVPGLFPGLFRPGPFGPGAGREQVERFDRVAFGREPVDDAVRPGQEDSRSTGP